MKTFKCLFVTLVLAIFTFSLSLPATAQDIRFVKEGKCHQVDSKIRFNDFYGEVKIRCSFEEFDSFEFVDLDTEIYEDDLIKTEEESGAILGLEDMSTYIIYPETSLVIHTEEANISKWEMIIGTMLTNIKKMSEGKSLEVEMSQCVWHRRHHSGV